MHRTIQVQLALLKRTHGNSRFRGLGDPASCTGDIFDPIQLRLIANLLDGLVAVEGGKRTPTGELYNEAPDRIADTAVLVGAGYAVGGSPWCRQRPSPRCGSSAR